MTGQIRLAPRKTAPKPQPMQISRATAKLATRQLGALALAAAMVVVTFVWARHRNMFLGPAAPLLGHFDLRVSARIIPAAALAVLAFTLAPRAAERLRWRQLLGATWLAALGWAVLLALADGPAGITHPLATGDEYVPDLKHVHGIGAYLSGFVAHVSHPVAGQFAWSDHVAGGPPGTLLAFALLARIGLSAPVWAAMLVVVVGAAAAPAATLAVRHVDSERSARRAAPFLAFAPIAIWLATSADALFLGLSAVGVASLAVAASSAGRRSDAFALGGGLLLGLALYCSYGVAPLGGVAVAVVVCAKRVRPLIVGAIGVGVVAAAFASSGFWWFTGLDATRIRYAEGLARLRPYDYFLLADLAALAIAVGPAAIAALATLTSRSRLWWPVGGALLAVVTADVSGLSKGEVERIWLPFAIWLLVATAVFGGRRAARLWLAGQLVTALVLQVVLVTNW